eukprot:gnl/TRDRNA2_/TRDRNA2_40502_c0_seq1.p1 gnl/TRDRNA2_/TRDRNA2_40502_c0~~gnl/TRDRNA2_/TRDRNA2_40502_c0_seq1.p1  ORF type:complete len:829 (-),score=132.38 gnl/TRDRNA2_/TRDRNA2_40502_c0_seq1:39-2525(-)
MPAQGQTTDSSGLLREMDAPEVTGQPAATQSSPQKGDNQGDEEDPHLIRLIRDGVRGEYVKKLLAKELDEAGACMQLPWTVLLFVSFVAAVMGHEKFEYLHMMDRSLEFDIIENANFAFSGIVPFQNGRMGHKSVYDVNTMADFWSWMTMGLVPLLWAESWDVNEPRTNTIVACTTAADNLAGWDNHWANASSGPLGTPFFDQNCPEPPNQPLPKKYLGEEPRGMYLYYNRLLGGMRLRQENRGGDAADCPEAGGLADKVFAAPCYFGKYWLKPEMREGMEIDHSMVKETIIVKTLLSQAEVRQQLRKLEDELWVSPASQKVEISFASYNGNLGVLSLTFVNFFFTRAGHIHKQISPVSTWVLPYHDPDPWCYIFDICWLLLVLKIAIPELIEFTHLIRVRGIRGAISIYFDIWNFIDWVSIVYSVFIVVMWMLVLADTRDLRKWLSVAELTRPGTFETDQDRVDFFDSAQKVVMRKHSVGFYTALYPFIIAARFFKAYSAQPRLSVVTQTLADSFVDVYHFGVVFLTIFMVFCFSAMILFGQDLVEYVNFPRAINTCWRTLLGDFDWDALSDVGRLQAAIWFWAFTLLVLQILLNMLLAVIMDVYSAVKGSVDPDSETLVTQSIEIYERWRGVWRGELVPLSVLLEALKDEHTAEDRIPDDALLRPRDLQELVPQMQDAQATELLLQAQAMCDKENFSEATPADVAAQITAVELRQKTQNAQIEQLSLNLIRAGPQKANGAPSPSPTKVSSDGACSLTSAVQALTTQIAELREITLRNEQIREKTSLMVERNLADSKQRLSQVEVVLGQAIGELPAIAALSSATPGS